MSRLGVLPSGAITLRFEKKFKNFTKKAKAAIYFNQYEYVYVLLKLIFYCIEDSTIRTMNLEMYQCEINPVKRSKLHLIARQRQKYKVKDSDAQEQLYEIQIRYIKTADC